MKKNIIFSIAHNNMEANERLSYFLKNMEVKVYDGDTIIDLMDFFPTLRKGIYMKSTILGLLYLYYRQNKLSDENYVVTMDEPMKRCFGDVGPTNFGGLHQLVDDNSVELGYGPSDAYAERVISYYLCTESLTKNFDFYEIMEVMRTRNKTHVSTLLKQHPKVDKLHYSIVYHKYNKIKESFTRCPILNKYRCYELAKRRKDDNITKLVLDNIILTILLQQELMGLFISSTSLVSDLYRLIF